MALCSTGWFWWTQFKEHENQKFCQCASQLWTVQTQNTARLPQGPLEAETHFERYLSGFVGLGWCPVIYPSSHWTHHFKDTSKACLFVGDFKLGCFTLYVNGLGTFQSSAEGNWIWAIPEAICKCRFDALSLHFLSCKENYWLCFQPIFWLEINVKTKNPQTEVILYLRNLRPEGIC